MKHLKFEENILVDEAYTGGFDKNADQKKKKGIAKNFADNLEYDEAKKWYSELPAEPPIVNKLSYEEIEVLRREASSILLADTTQYEHYANKSQNSDEQWARTLLRKGAINDRVAAGTILIQQNPLYNLSVLRNMIQQVKPAKKKDGLVIIDALSELLISDLLVPNVKLSKFDEHAVGHLTELSSGNKDLRRKILKLWYFEDQLKELYGCYVDALNKFAHDSVDSNREKSVSCMCYLLMHHPEKEKILLNNIINKLGDPVQSVASKVIYHLCQLLYNHPNMKSVVFHEIERMLFRSNISSRAQYYAICFLNQFCLDKDDTNVAEKLIDLYFSFFKLCIKTGSIDTRLMSAILTGVKRAYPFANVERITSTSQHIDAVHKIVHLSHCTVAVDALSLLAQITGSSQTNDERFYNSLYRKLCDPTLLSMTNMALLFSLIYKALKRDTSAERVCSFLKRLLQLCGHMQPAHACGTLYIIAQVVNDTDKRDIMKLSWEAVKQEEPVRDETVTDGYKSDQTDVVNEYESESAVNDESKVNDGKKSFNYKMDLLKGNKRDLLEDDEEEHYQDLKLDDTGAVRPRRNNTLRSGAAPGWYHAGIKTEATSEDNDKELKDKIHLRRTINMDKDDVHKEYDPLARNPLYSSATNSVFTELYLLAKHFHPTVQLFANKLINGTVIHYSGDPLIDFSGVRFLDRFVFKNPKNLDHGRQSQDGDTIKKVKGSHPKFAVRRNYTVKGIKSIPVNSSTYINEDPSKIPVDEMFLHSYFQKRRELSEKVDSELDSDADSVTSEDFESYLDQVTGPKPDAEGEELDFLGDVESSASRRKKSTKPSDPDDGAQSSDNEDDLLDAEVEDGEFDELLSDGDDEEVMGSVMSDHDEELQLEGSDEDETIDHPSLSKQGRRKKGRAGKLDLSTVFASAEEFSSILDETAGGDRRHGTSQDVMNMEGASVKQLAWEDRRNNWIKGYGKKNKRPGGTAKRKRQDTKTSSGKRKKI